MSFLVKIWSSVILLFSCVFLYIRNSLLLTKNDELKDKVDQLKQKSDIQGKVINATKKVKTTNIDGIADLMRKDKL